MKFLVDAQLPRRIALWLREQGHDALHTLDLPDKNFVEFFILHHKPEKLLLISTGNISNPELERLLLPHVEAIAVAFETTDFIELSRLGVMLHG